MTRSRIGPLSVCAALALATAAPAADPPAWAKDADALAGRIDHHVRAAWDRAKVTPAPTADDGEFVRRVYLDLAGRIPNVAEAREFLEDSRPDKRPRLVEKLLDDPTYVSHFVRVWRALLMPEVATSLQAGILRGGFDSWIRQQVRENVPYDKMVRDLLTAPLGNQQAFGGTQSNPAAFYLAKEMKPENLAAATARLFLGVRLECAQCHNHPFAEWKKEQFWELAAYFAGVQAQGRGGDFVQAGREIKDVREITIPNTDKKVAAKVPAARQPEWKASGRETLADWVTAKDNPFFARAIVNRAWAHFFGTGIVDPVDEMVGTDAAPSHPELLDELARDFAAHGYDLKYLMRAIAASQAYQRSSAAPEGSPGDSRLFHRAAVRSLTPDQLFDSLMAATGWREGGGPRGRGQVIVIGGAGGARDEFVSKFSSPGDAPTDVQTSILQALTLMNGRMIADATDLARSETFAGILDAPFLDTASRVEALYLSTLSRKPKPRELERAIAYVERAVASPDPKVADDSKKYGAALSDVLWALLNSGEFYTNH